MRYNHSHISLTVREQLSAEDAKKWRETVALIAPSGVVSSASIMVNGNTKTSDLYAVNGNSTVTYVVPLSRDLLEDEAGKTAIAWSAAWPDGDFEITFSQKEARQSRKAESASVLFDEIAENIAKLLHAEWVNTKVSYRWNYSPRYNPSQKQHPMLLPWEQLPASKRQSEIDRARKTLEILDSIDLKISRK